MKHINNSQPLAVATQYAPLSTSMHIVVKGGLSTVQFYKQNQQEWLPDHTHAERYNDIGALVDGPLTLRADYSIIDKDGLIRDGDLVPQVYWFVDGKQITDTDLYHWQPSRHPQELYSPTRCCCGMRMPIHRHTHGFTFRAV